MLTSIVLAVLLVQAAAAAPPAQTAPEQPWPPASVERKGPGITMPRAVSDTRPSYTADALRAKIQGRVVMEVVVQADGTVGDVRVKKSLDRKFGLDDEAVRAVKTWRFAPGKKNGATVPVLVEIEMTFTTR